MSDRGPQEAAPPTERARVGDINKELDPILVMVVGLIEGLKSAELGLTLHVSGVVIPGILVSATSFADHLRDWLTQIAGRDVGESFDRVVAAFSSLAEAGSPEVAELEDEPSGGDFIHLRDARVFTSGSDRPLPGMLWRGRLSHVSAWSFGVMEVDALARFGLAHRNRERVRHLLLARMRVVSQELPDEHPAETRCRCGALTTCSERCCVGQA